MPAESHRHSDARATSVSSGETSAAEQDEARPKSDPPGGTTGRVECGTGG